MWLVEKITNHQKQSHQQRWDCFFWWKQNPRKLPSWKMIIWPLRLLGVGIMSLLFRKCAHYQAVPGQTAPLDAVDISIASCFIPAFHLLL